MRCANLSRYFGLGVGVLKPGVFLSRGRHSIVKCDRGANHPGPFYTLSVWAQECGAGVFVKGRRRVNRRKRIARLCVGCLRKTEFGFKGAALFTPEAVDPAAD